MQEEIENRTVTLVISATKRTGRVRKAGGCEVPGTPSSLRSNTSVTSQMRFFLSNKYLWLRKQKNKEAA